MRVPEHKQDSKKAHEETPFFKHLIDTEHTFDFEDSQILDTEPHCVTSKLINIHAQIAFHIQTIISNNQTFVNNMTI